MSQIRKAHSVEIIDRRLRDCEVGGVEQMDLMELVGLYDELSRVERKWRDKAQGPPRTAPRARPLADPVQMNTRFERLGRLIDAALRRTDHSGTAATAERQLLQRAAEALRARTPLPT